MCLPLPTCFRRWRESYQRLHPAQYILDKYEGQRYVVLACDVDEVPRRTVVKDLRGPLYPRAADGLYFEMHFLYYNFRRARLPASQGCILRYTSCTTTSGAPGCKFYTCCYATRVLHCMCKISGMHNNAPHT